MSERQSFSTLLCFSLDSIEAWSNFVIIKQMIMKDIRSRLNQLQLAHAEGKGNCDSGKCQYPGCSNCLCGKRRDSKFCCDLHRCQMNNDINEKKHYQTNENNAIHKRNTNLVLNTFNRGIIKFDHHFLNGIGFNFNAAPVAAVYGDKVLAVYADVGMWRDDNQIFHLIKLPSLNHEKPKLF